MRPHEHGMLQVIWAALRRPVPRRGAGFFVFGWLLVVLFATQIVTGILLSMYYQPSPKMVAESVQHIMRDVQWGWLIRGMHHWSGHGMVALCAVQLARVFLARAYRGARSSQWYLGLSMAVLIAITAFSGELLVFDNAAYWTMKRTLETIESFPILGDAVAQILRGGDDVNGTTLGRAYSVHSMLLPWLTFLLLVFSSWLRGHYAGDHTEDAP